MSSSSPQFGDCQFIECLEPRIAPAGFNIGPSNTVSVVVGGSILLHAGQALATSNTGGAVLLYVQAGEALVFTTDVNGDHQLDYNDITGIAAGNGLQMTSFVSIYGDIVTNLQPNGELTDSGNHATSQRDGQILLNSSIVGITLRSITNADLNTTVAGNTAANRVELSSYSIFGNILVGGSFGSDGNGLVIDTSGTALQQAAFNGVTGIQLFHGVNPVIGDIRTGTAAGGQPFSFGTSAGFNVTGTLLPFTPLAGQTGGDIIGVSAVNGATFSVGTLETGDGGAGARGGNISEVTLNGDHGGYQIIAGDGGAGTTGGAGGSIIGLVDMGSIASEIVVESGSGGQGLLGAGGEAGTVTFGQYNVAANLHVVLGNGGSGFSSGGDGSSLPAGVFTSPEGMIPVGATVVATQHDMFIPDQNHPGQLILAHEVGTFQPVDFNGDGFGDAVYTTTNPDQVVVALGDGQGGFSQFIYLDSPIDPTSVAIGDFTGSGHPDIAVASSNPNNFGGVEVFINQFATNPQHPFASPIFSQLPNLAVDGYYNGSNPITGIVAGDFLGNGVIDLAVVAKETGLVTLNQQDVVIFLFNKTTTANPHGTGYFYANTAPATQLGNVVIDAFDPGAPTPVLAATALTSTSAANQPETLYVGGVGGTTITAIDLDISSTTGQPALNLEPPPSIGLGQVNTGTAAKPALTTANLQDFTVELRPDGDAAIVAITSTPQGFIIIADAPSGVIGTLPAGGGDGFNFGAPNGGFLGNTDAVAIRAIDLNGATNHVAILDDYTNDNAPQIIELTLLNAAGTGSGIAQVEIGPADTTFTLFAPLTKAPGVIGFDVFYPQVGTAAAPIANPVTGFGVLEPSNANFEYANIQFFDPAVTGFGGGFGFVGPTFIQYLTQNGIVVAAGNGGNSLVGNAGAGGTIGQGLVLGGGGANGAVSVTYPAYAAYEGTDVFIGGNGGSGFTGGGAGGTISDISARYAATATLLTSSFSLTAGNGGDSVAGLAGAGGSIAAISIQTGNTFIAGNGGNGYLAGGNGGSVTGNGLAGSYDTNGEVAIVTAGAGGSGQLNGGNGGNITGFKAQFLQVVGAVAPGPLAYTAGAAGSSVSGIGGQGGSVVNSSPDPTINYLGGAITLSGGAGGNGLAGGAGGSVTNFVNAPNGSVLPTTFDVLAGNGGAGVTGAGGAGGSVSTVNVTAIGLNPNFGGTTVDFVRVLAGNGGPSFGDQGGVGGSVTGINVTAESAPLAVASGAGGTGLIAGGNGGNVLNDSVNSAAQLVGKVLVIAGAGGDTASLLPGDVVNNDGSVPPATALGVLSFGGYSGIGGNGGNITNFVQPASVQTSVDLIAGNGGSTLNYGTPLDTVVNVGAGGSVTNVTLAGEAGTSGVDPNTGISPPIRDYTDLNGTGHPVETIAQFVQNQLGGSVVDGIFVPVDSTYALTSESGNVGIVAGAAGRVRAVDGVPQPATGGINGSVEFVTATNIMSVVAGSVDNVSPVQDVNGLTVTSTAHIIGADKSPTDPTLPNYNPAGTGDNVVEYLMPQSNGTFVEVIGDLEPGDRLLDGAVFALDNSTGDLSGGFGNPRIFIRPGA